MNNPQATFFVREIQFAFLKKTVKSSAMIRTSILFSSNRTFLNWLDRGDYILDIKEGTSYTPIPVPAGVQGPVVFIILK